MDTRRCALFLIKCVQGFAAISKRWTTWKCNFQHLSLLLLAKASFLSHASLYGYALEMTFFLFLCMCAWALKCVCFSCRYVHMNRRLHVRVSFIACIGLSCLPVDEHPQHLTNTAQLLCYTQLSHHDTRPHPNQWLFLDTMSSPIHNWPKLRPWSLPSTTTTFIS